MSAADYPDDPVEAAAVLRARAIAEPIDDDSLATVAEPWRFISGLWQLRFASVRAVVTPLLDDADPRVARRAVAFLGAGVRDDAVFARLAAIAEACALPHAASRELQLALSAWARGDAEARRVAALVRRLAGDALPAVHRPVAAFEAAWLVEVARERCGHGDGRADEVCVAACGVIAACCADQLLAFLTAARRLRAPQRLRALDEVGEVLAVTAAAHPTLADCRAALGEPDAAPRTRSFARATATGRGDDAALSAAVRDALGPGSTVTVKRDGNFVPADVNNAEIDDEWQLVTGVRGDGVTLTVRVEAGATAASFATTATAPADRDRILAAVWRALGRSRPAWDAA
jgi:hypothetical protein|nr:hypothetical protein [Kofleriaceae bacterium]